MKRTSVLQVLLPLAFLQASCPLLVAETQPKVETPLAEAVKSFNEMAAKDQIGKQQAPLTEGEIIGGIQWWKSQHRRSMTMAVSRHRTHKMKNIIAILTLLLVPYLGLSLAHVPAPWPGRVSLALVFAFTGLGHFIKTAEMVQMLPPWFPVRILLIYATGAFELLAAVCILIPQVSHYSGIFLCAFLILVLPSNVYAAVRRVDFGGHAAGPVYLLIRVPLQLLLVGWVYWFTIRS